MLFTKSEFLSYKLNNFSEYKWPHNDIVNEIKKNNKNLVSTLAILPDTKEINTFNLEAEASRQGEYIAVRQVISNKETYKDDLEYFDWFLIKTGNQGVMSNESKNLLNQYLLKSPSFILQKEWYLKDKSKLMLLKRRSLNTYIIKFVIFFHECYINVCVYINPFNKFRNIFIFILLISSFFGGVFSYKYLYGYT